VCWLHLTSYYNTDMLGMTIATFFLASMSLHLE
jgi:hypothetical protein